MIDMTTCPDHFIGAEDLRCHTCGFDAAFMTKTNTQDKESTVKCIRFNSDVVPAGYRAFSDGTGGVSYAQPRLYCDWTFEDGVKLHVEERRGRRVIGRTSYTDRVLRRKAVVFVDVPFRGLQDLADRRARPWQEWKPIVAGVLGRVGITFDRLRWDQRAGCTCPCSPGFIVEGGPTLDDDYNGAQYWMTVTIPDANHVVENGLPVRIEVNAS